MGNRFLEIASTPSVRATQAELGSRHVYARLEGGLPANHRLGQREAMFLSERDSFYLASVSETGWPYVQHRGGPVGFLKVLDDVTLGFADFRGNRQYISLGNIRADDRVALIAVDYPTRQRLKLFGRVGVVDLAADAAFVASVTDPAYGARIERGFRITIEAFDWNCPQHITPRFSQAERAQELAQRVSTLQAENAWLHARLEQASGETS